MNELGECKSCAKYFSGQMLSCPFCGIKNNSKNETPLSCINCHSNMLVKAIEDFSYRLCKNNCVIHLDNQLIEKFPYPKLLKELEGIDKRIDAHLYVKCPKCSKIMNNTSIHTISKIRLRRCLKHGTWIDTGLLKEISHFIENGGVEREAEYIKSIEWEKHIQSRNRLMDRRDDDCNGQFDSTL